MTPHDAADADFRTAPAPALAAALRASRHETLAAFAAFEAALPGLRVPQAETLNPPLWELGHVGWFQQFWLHRNPERHRGWRADPLAPRSAAVAPDSDTLFDSSRVPHASRWALPLPQAPALHDALAVGLERTLALMSGGADGGSNSGNGNDSDDGNGNGNDSDDRLYFHRLVLAHEDMHHEAALYMAQALGLPPHHSRWQSRALALPRQTLSFAAGNFDQGWQGAGFAFDNELGAHGIELPASHIDSRVLRWGEVLPFAEAGGYAQPRWWSEPGRAWLAASGASAPRHLRRVGSAWQQQQAGTWQALDPDLPACHLNAFEAEAWCAWAGRRLPTEAEWERAAVQGGPAFHWGEVWEWTASPFTPYPGFVVHPYRDYSAPWFGSRRVLRGASFATQPRLRHVRYRNYFTPERNDIFAGLRSCAL